MWGTENTNINQEEKRQQHSQTLANNNSITTQKPFKDHTRLHEAPRGSTRLHQAPVGVTSILRTACRSSRAHTAAHMKSCHSCSVWLHRLSFSTILREHTEVHTFTSKPDHSRVPLVPFIMYISLNLLHSFFDKPGEAADLGSSSQSPCSWGVLTYTAAAAVDPSFIFNIAHLHSLSQMNVLIFQLSH